MLRATTEAAWEDDMASMTEVLEAARASRRPRVRARTAGPQWPGRPAQPAYFLTRCGRVIRAAGVASHRRDHPAEPRPARV